MKLIAKTATLAASAGTAIVLSIAGSQAMALTVTQTNDSNTLLNSLLGSTSGLSNFDITVTGAPNAFGTFQNDPFGLGSGIVLSTGKATDVVGPNNSTGQSSINGQPGISGTPGSFDGAQIDISFDVDATASKLFFQYVFGSEEFLEFAGTQFNDAFNLKLNGVNLALLSNGNPVTINNLAAGSGGPFDPAFVNNVGGVATNDTQLDGYTKALLFEGLLNKNAKNTLTIQIADVGDSSLDSAVFIKGNSVSTQPPSSKVPTPALLPGLIGLGMGVLRKRKAEAAKQTSEV